MNYSDTERSLLEAIKADPKDQAPRLIYADFLSERGREMESLAQLAAAERLLGKSRPDRVSDLLGVILDAAEISNDGDQMTFWVNTGEIYRFWHEKD